MNKIITVEEAARISTKLKKENKSIVLAGGCFDILHRGHLTFLNEAKKRGDVLFLLLESDESIKERKGEKRPVNSQKMRAIALSKLKSVDIIIPLPGVTKDDDYDRMIVQIMPTVIAQTEGDANSKRRAQQSQMVGAKLESVTKRVRHLSTTEIINKKNYGSP